MKTAVKFLPLIVIFSGVAFSGCYTELATTDNDGDEYYANSDTTYDENGNVVINNNYYLDDNYRRSRFRVSFNYYFPSYHSSWIASYYYSYYDEWYWGWHRPWWWYHYYPYYTVIYPTPWWPPIYDPWYPYWYYPAVVYYPPYYYPPYYGYNPPVTTGRVRTDGSTRDQRDPGERARPIPTTPSPGTTVAAGGTEVRERIPTERATTINEREREKPWWEKIGSAQQVEQRKRVVDEPRRSEERTDRAATPPPVRVKPREDRKVEEGTKNETPRYHPPRRSTPQNDQPPAERPRDERRSYSPPQRQAPPPSSAPRSNGGGTSGTGQNNGGRKRAD